MKDQIDITTEQSEAITMLLMIESYADFVLRGIVSKTSLQDKYLKEITSLRDSAKGIISNLGNISKQNYDLDTLESLNYSQIRDIIFTQNHSTTVTDQINNQQSSNSSASLAAQGLMQDLANPFLNFMLGDTLKLSPEILSSEYGKLTEGVRRELVKLQNNAPFVEVTATARLLIGNLIINKAAWLMAGCEPLPDPKWLKSTKVYKYSCKINDTLDHYTPEFIQGCKKYLEEVNKVFNKKGKNLATLAIASLSDDPLIPIAIAATTIGFTSGSTYLADERNKAIADERAHLKEYIDAKDRVNTVLKENPVLRRIPNLITTEIESENITNNADNELEELYQKHPVLTKIFGEKKQKFAGIKEKVMFVQALKELVEQNDRSTGKNKIWNEGDTEISKGKIVVAQHYFAKAFKRQIIKYKNLGVELYEEIDTPYGNQTSLIDPKLAKMAQKLFNALKNGDHTAAQKAVYLLYSAYNKQNINSLTHSKEKEVLREISTLRMEVPKYKIEISSNGREKLGCYKHDLANIAFEKQAQAMALESMSRKELNHLESEQITALYKEELKKSKDKLKEDPLFSESILTPTITSRAFSAASGILNAINPWGTKVSLNKKTKDLKSSTKNSISSSVALMQEIRECNSSVLRERITSFDSLISEIDLSTAREAISTTRTLHSPSSVSEIDHNYDLQSFTRVFPSLHSTVSLTNSDKGSSTGIRKRTSKATKSILR